MIDRHRRLNEGDRVEEALRPASRLAGQEHVDDDELLDEAVDDPRPAPPEVFEAELVVAVLQELVEALDRAGRVHRQEEHVREEGGEPMLADVLAMALDDVVDELEREVGGAERDDDERVTGCGDAVGVIARLHDRRRHHLRMEERRQVLVEREVEQHRAAGEAASATCNARRASASPRRRDNRSRTERPRSR